MIVSIITAVKNERSGLEKTIQSVVAQTHHHIEHIVIDGASTDGTMELLQEYEKKIFPTPSSPLTLKWISEPDSGIYQAMNKGIARATGNYVLFLNAGDTLIDPDVVGKLVRHIGNSGGAELYHGLMQIQGSSHISGEEFAVMRQWKLFFWNVPHPAILYRRDLFAKYGGYKEDTRIAGDYEFLLRLLIASSVGSRYVPLTITSFDINGLSALPENKVLMRREIETIRSRYFSGVYRLLNRSELLEKVARAFMKRLFL